MDCALVVKSPLPGFEVGARVDDAATVATLLRDHPASVVQVAPRPDY